MKCVLCIAQTATEFIGGHGVCQPCVVQITKALTRCEWHDDLAQEDDPYVCDEEGCIIGPEGCECVTEPCDICEPPNDSQIAAVVERRVRERRREQEAQLQGALALVPDA